MYKRIMTASKLGAGAVLALVCSLTAAPYLYENISPAVGTSIGISLMVVTCAALTMSILALTVGPD